MDTDDLSAEAYKGIIIEAEKYNHDLSLQFGVIASSCKNENEYLDKAKELIKEIRGLDNDELSDIFFGSLPDLDALHLTLDKILSNISEVEKIQETQDIMIIKPKQGNNFKHISLDAYIEKHIRLNSGTDSKALKKSLLYFRQLKTEGIKCQCGDELWVIGSAIAGKGCFRCITNESDKSDDYEIK